MDEQQLRDLVRAALLKELGSTPSKALITEEDVNRVAEGGFLRLPANALLTPLARQAALDRRISLVEGDVPIPEPAPTTPQMRVVAMGADHGGYPLKSALKKFIQGLGYSVLDMGTHSRDAVDYPDYAHLVARAVSENQAWRGILIDGAGIGSSMAANKVPGVRAALCYDQATALNSREHNDANVLTLGAGMISEAVAQQIVEVWLKTDFGGGRHARRVNKIMAIERHYSKHRD